MNMVSNIPKIYLLNFLKSLYFHLPIFMIYFKSRGISYGQVMIFLALQSAFQIIFEVPSGIFADKFGRKNALIIANITRLIAIIIYILAYNVWTFALVAPFWGISLAFESGSDSALVYDTLKMIGKTNEFTKVEGHAHFYNLLGWGVAGLVGGFLAEFSLRLPYFCSGIAFVITTILSFFLVEPRHTKEIADLNYFKHLKEALNIALKHPKIKWLIIFSALMMSMMLVSHRFFQPYMKLANIDLKYFGIIYFIWLLISSLSAHYAYKIKNKIGEFTALLIIPAFLGLHLILMGKYVFFYGIAFVFLGEFTWGFIRPIVNNAINHEIESYNRATILSLKGFAQSIGLIILSPIFGYLADWLSITTALFIQGVIVLVLGLPLVYKVIQVKKVRTW